MSSAPKFAIMRSRISVLVAVATIFQAFSISQITAFSINNEKLLLNYKSNLTKNHHLNVSLEKLQPKWVSRVVIPAYLKEFISIFQKSNDTIGSISGDRMIAGFFDELFSGVSDENCKEHVGEWFRRLLTFRQLENLIDESNTWVLQMADAWGKLPEGILTGHVNMFGDFHECVQIQVEDLKISSESIKKGFDGQYCTSYLLDYATSMQVTPKPVDAKVQLQGNIEVHESVSLAEFLKMVITPSFAMIIPSVGVCVPNSCSLPDVQQILANGINMFYSAIPDPEDKIEPKSLLWPVTVNCVDRHKPYFDAPVIIVIILISTLAALCLVAGIIDYWYQSSEKSCGPPHHRAYKYLMAFSFHTNMKKWMSTRKSADDLGCLHGIRFLSTAWVVLAHTYFVFIQGPQWNMIDIRNVNKNWTVLAVINATFSVDTFFVMSGMLATYNILKMLDKSRGKFNVIMFYVHRYIRLTPTYAILVGIGATLISYAGNGPAWYSIELGEENCRKNWWKNILYINNLFSMEEMCNGESWYLANDMQFYILSPLIVYPLWRWEVLGLILLLIYTMLSCIAPVLVVHYADAPAAMAVTGSLENGTGTTEIYIRPWSRISTFLVGVWIGWLLHKTRGKRLNLSRLTAGALWLGSTGLALTVIFAIYPWFKPENPIPTVPGYFYAGLSRFSWGVALGWVIIACVKGYGGIINRFLGWKVFMPLGRLCFSVYLTSIHLQSIFHQRLSVPIKWDTYTVVNLFFAHLVMSYFVGFICTLIFESPFITLQKLIFEPATKKVETKPAVLSSPKEAEANNNTAIES